MSASKTHPYAPTETLASRIGRLALIVLASVIMAVNIRSFVDAGGLVPGGFNGLTLLIQRIADQFFHIALPFSLVNFLLNAVPAVISFRMIGKRFTIYSCIMIVLTSLLTDLIPSMPITNDILLICVFGGLINGFAISLCLLGRATSGGTDFIAVAVSERLHVVAWNYILLGNAAMLAAAGVLFGWDKALYSIIFQFTSTQVVRLLNPRYKRNTLFIITDKPEAIYARIKDITHHGATLFRGTGLYNGQERDMIYSIIGSQEVKAVLHCIREEDPKAFVNILKTDQVAGNFYQRPND